MEGIKHDDKKPKMGLVIGGFAEALEHVGKVGTFGADKYAPDNWKKVENGIDRYTDAMYRHLLAEAKGETRDPETGLHHAAHAAWNSLARLSFILHYEHFYLEGD